MQKNTLIVIPARYKSKRFPAKVIANLGGKPLVQWVYDASVKSKLGKVVIATDDKRVEKICSRFCKNVIRTSAKCNSGTDRVWQVAKKHKCKHIINVQADMPFIQPETIKSVYKKLKNTSDCDIATAYYDITDTSEIKNPNNVKIVMTSNGRAMYFSRSVTPYSGQKKSAYHKHYGIYAFKRSTLEKFVKLKQSALEKAEKLEQLRALEAGMNIYCIKTNYQGPTIDTPADIKKAERYINRLPN